MTEYRLFDPEDKPEWLDSRWWIETPNCNHLDNRVHRARLEAAAANSVLEAERYGVRTIVDLGAGDGGLLSLLPQPYMSGSFGYEIITDSIRYAKEVRGVNVIEANVLTDRLTLGPVVVATEMLEHLEDPHGFVRGILDARPEVRSFVASSPHSETDVYHEWNHAWAWDRDGYRAMFEDVGWTVVGHYDAEWSQILVARRP